MQGGVIMSRKSLSIWEKERKEQFDKMVKGFCIEGLQNIIKIANNALDQKVKLQANIFLIEKAVGKNYTAFNDETEQTAQKVTINLITTGDTYKQNEHDEQEIWDAENLLCDDEEDDDNWGGDVYLPK